MWIYLNGRMVEEAEARISVMDRGFLYGDGVFETVRIYHGRPVWLDRHLARLSQSCQAVHLEPPLPAINWQDVFQQVIARNQLDHAMIRLTLSRGPQDPGDIGARTSESCDDPTVVLIPRPLRHITAQQRLDGVPIITTTIRRSSPLSSPTHAKTLNYLNNLLAAREATAQGAFEGLQLTLDGYLAECAMSNVFFVTQNTLHTPSLDCGVLPGVTRGIVLEAAPAIGLHVREGRYLPDVLYEADECFVTSSGIGILPVATIDGRPLPKQSSGSWVATLQRRYDRMIGEER